MFFRNFFSIKILFLFVCVTVLLVTIFSPGWYGLRADTCTRPFYDVPCNHWALEAITWAKNRRVAYGYNDGSFRPDYTASRADAIAFIVRYVAGETLYCNGVLCEKAPQYFVDAGPDNPFYKYIQYAGYTGISRGVVLPNGTRYFLPYRPVKHDEIATFIVRAIYGENFSYSSTPYFSDVLSSSEFFKYIQKFKEMGLTRGIGSSGSIFCPDRYVSRAEAVTYLCKWAGAC